MTLFERVSELAKKQGKSLNKVAEDNGLSKNALYQWKTSSPKAETLELIANYFHVSTDYLLGRTDNSDFISADNSVKTSARQIMMRMDTEGLSEEDFDEVEKEMERFLKWRIEEIKREKDGEVK